MNTLKLAGALLGEEVLERITNIRGFRPPQLRQSVRDLGYLVYRSFTDRSSVKKVLSPMGRCRQYQFKHLVDTQFKR